MTFLQIASRPASGLRRGASHGTGEPAVNFVGRWALPSGAAFRVRAVEPGGLARCTVDGGGAWRVHVRDLERLRRERKLRRLGR